MSTTRILTLEAHPETVFDTLLGAAEAMELQTHVIDPSRRQAEFRRSGKSYRVAASVTDNGWSQAILHLSWTPPGSSGGGKCAKRLAKATSKSLAGMVEPPPPAPTDG